MEIFLNKIKMLKKAVGIIILYDNKEILLSKRSGKEERMAGKWENVGGKLEENETYMEAAIRELKEELGGKILDSIELLPEPLLHWTEEDEDSWEVQVFLANTKDKFEPKIPDAEKELVEEIKWFDLGQLPLEDLASYTKEDYKKLKEMDLAPFNRAAV